MSCELSQAMIARCYGQPLGPSWPGDGGWPSALRLSECSCPRVQRLVERTLVNGEGLHISVSDFVESHGHRFKSNTFLGSRFT